MELREQLSSCLFCAILLAAIPFSENFEVISSPTVTGIVGQDVVLPCHISTGTQPDNMEVQWKKIIQAAIETVHEYRANPGQDLPGLNYQGRTALLKDGFTSGNVSLKLKNVQPADEGTYSCIVKSNEWSADAATELKIAAVASVSIDVLGPQGQGIDLACRSAGWFPKPELRWVTKNGQDLQPVTKTEQGRELLFSVLSHVTVLGEETGEISCIIQNSLLKTEQKSVVLLSSDIFPHGSPWLAAFWVLLTLDLLVIGACAFWGYKEKQKASKKKTSEDEILLNKETRRKALESDCQELQERLDRAVTELDFRKARSYMVSVTLNPSYEHPELTVSEDGRKVQHNTPSLEPAATSGALIFVGMKGFVARKDHVREGGVCRWYWEVEVGDSPHWELGVLSETVRNRVTQERLEKLPEGGCWALERSEGKYHPEEADTVLQNWGVRPTVVGVYLDLEGGNLSFYSVNSMALILEIPVEGSERLFPFLIPGYTVGRDHRKPLSICPPSDWDFPQKLTVSGSVSEGDHTALAQSSNSSMGKGQETTQGHPQQEKQPQPLNIPLPPTTRKGQETTQGHPQQEKQPQSLHSPLPPTTGKGQETTQGHLQQEKQPQPLHSPLPPADQGAGNNTGPFVTEETAPHPEQPSAPADQDVKGNSTSFSWVKNVRNPFHIPKRRKGDETEQEHLQAEGGKEMPNPKV